MERLIELFINTEDGEFYDRGGLLAVDTPPFYKIGGNDA